MTVEVCELVDGKETVVAVVRYDERAGVIIEADNEGTRETVADRMDVYSIDDGALWVADLPNAISTTYFWARFADETSAATAAALLEADDEGAEAEG